LNSVPLKAGSITAFPWVCGMLVIQLGPAQVGQVGQGVALPLMPAHWACAGRQGASRARAMRSHVAFRASDAAGKIAANSPFMDFLPAANKTSDSPFASKTTA